MIDKKKYDRIYILDDLRGIAILTVLFYHYFFVFYIKNDVTNDFTIFFKEMTNYLNFGAYGVSLFFLVSGFVIPMSLKDENRTKSVYNFFIKRFFRLFPTYWFAIILISFIILLFDDPSAYTFKQIVINFTMLQDIFKTESIDGVFWTLMIELKFYILTAILFYFGLLKDIKFIILALFVLSVITLYLGKFGNNLWSYLMVMYLGTTFYFYYKKKISKKVLTLLTVVVSFYFLNNHYFLSDEGYGKTIGYSMATILAILSFILALKYKNTLSKVTTFFGNISYSFYLLHQVLGYFLINNFLKIDISTPYSQIVTILIIVMISYFTNIYIEKSTNKFGHRHIV